MTEPEPITPVIFRTYPKRRGGDTIALFPYEHWDRAGSTCSSYTHVGQHGGAQYSGVMRDTRPATPEEYASLKRELEARPFGYRLRVIRRKGKR